MAKKSKSVRDKTRLTKAELSKEVQARLSAFVNSSTGGFLLLDENLNYMFLNPTAERMIGVSREAVVGKNILDIAPNIKESGRYDKYLNVLRTGEPFSVEDAVSHTKFGDIQLSLKAFKVGNWVGVIATDIIERKQAEEALRQSEQNFRVLFEGTLDGLFVVSAETGRIVLANRSAAKMFGFSSPEAIIGVYPINFITPPNRDEVLRFVAEDVLRDLSEDWSRSNREATEIRALANDGREIWLEIQGTPTEYQGELAYLVSSKDITERKKAQEALRRSEEYFRALIENAQDAIAILNGDGTMRYGSPAIERIWGYKVEDWSNKDYFEFVSPDDMQNAAETFARLLRNPGSRIYAEVHVRHKDGSIHVIEASGQNLLDNPSINGIVLNVRDITERKQAEEALREREERNRALVEAAGRAGEGIGIVQNVEGREGAFVFVNDELCRMLGYSREELLLMKAQDVINPDEFSEILDRYRRRQRREDMPSLYQLAFIRKDGTLLPIEAAFGIMTYSGKVATVAFLRDITERKKAEEALHFTRFALDNAGDAVVCISQDARYIDVNDAFCRSVGYSREELLSMTAHDIDLNYSAKIWAEFWEKLKRSGSLTFESCHRTKDGRVTPVEVKVTFFEYKGKEYHCGFARDITERKRAEEALRNERDNLLNTLNAVKDGVYIINQQNDIVFANPSTKEEFGPCEGKKCYEYFNDFKEPCPWCDSGQVIAGKVIRSEWVFPKNGKTYEVVHTSFSDTDGSISKLSIIRDITERKRMEESLKDSEERYRALVETSGQAGEGIIIVQNTEDREGAIVFANEEYGRITGYSREELLNKTAWDLVASDIIPEIQERYRLRQAGENVPPYYEGRILRKDGVLVPVESFMGIMTYQGKIATVAYTRDITERKRMEEALRQNEQTIRRLAKAAVSAHEEERHRVSLEVHDRISQTLTGAFHQLQALEAIPLENAEAQQILKRASDLLQESIHESRNIMEDLYSPVLSDFGIVAVIDEELHRFQKETGCRTRFDKRCAVSPTPEVELTVYRIFREALANIKRHAIGVTEVRVSLSDKAGMISLQVKDNGLGFDVEEVLQNMRVGGLKGMQRRAELGGGTFEMVSSPGQGTTVTVCLPCTSASDKGKEEKTT